MNLPEAFVALGAKLPQEHSVQNRLDRAYDIVRMPGYELQRHQDGTWTIDKLSSSLTEDTGAQYVVDTLAGTCTCPDHLEGRAYGLCKHRLAVWLQEIITGEDSEV